MNQNNDDPFFSASGDRTIIRPVPGGRTQDLRRQATPAFQTPNATTVGLGHLSKLNPLDNAASALLALIANLYNSPSHSAPEHLQKQLIQEVKAFEVSANQANIDQDTIQKASYALCTTIDEAVFNTPWGRQSGWAEQSLLSIFHREVSGGKRFFQMLQEQGQNPSRNLHLLELMYVCLSLGYQGRYRLEADGREKLGQIRSWLANLIRSNRGSVDAVLSPHWKGVDDRKSGLIRAIPLWVIFSVAAGFLLLLFMGLLLSLGSKANPVYAHIQSLDMDTHLPEIQLAPPPIDRVALLQRLLAPEIDQELVSILDDGKIEIRGDKGLFTSGSDQLIEGRVALVEKIADAVASPEYNHRTFQVIGHTDNVPIRTSVRFANNWELSKARAETIKGIIKQRQPQLGLRTDGKAETEPVADNSTQAGRARNRRVEITLD